MARKDLVLIGGGHSHAIALRKFAMNPLPDVRLTLITDTSHTPYSGMLPAHIAGFYSFEECHIDLRRLTRFAQAQLYLDSAIGLDLNNNQVICAHRPPVTFDYLSIDIGSTPEALSVKGAKEYAIPAKPVPQFLSAWNSIVERVTQHPDKPITLSIVGGGAGGVELALNIQTHLASLFGNYSEKLTLHLFHRGKELLHSHNRWVSRRLQDILVGRGVKLHLQESVCEVLPDKVICESGLTTPCDFTIWVTTASAPSWIRDSGLETDSKGFVLVNSFLQSVSHSPVFAAGDIATMQNHSYPKAGVFAVRQGKPLFENLQRIIQKQPLQPYKPQKRYLSLIGTGNKNAVASWGRLGWESPWFWRWKDKIDRQFMQRFGDLPSMDKPTAEDTLTMYCAGCGSKVGSATLERVLQRLQVPSHSDVLIGLAEPDDAAVVQVPANQLMVHTVDFFRSLIPDPFIFGQIATNHCLSDLYAMGATPQSALAIVTLPYATETKQEETLYQLLSGVLKGLQATPLVGGHTTEGAELAFGLACNGLVSPQKLLCKGGMIPEQVLILTKPLGTGTLFAAEMRYQAKGWWIEEAVQSMLLSNQRAAEILIEHSATACTDITGFGLLGHLGEMVTASKVAVKLNIEAIPLLAGAMECIKGGFKSSLYPQNLQASQFISNLLKAQQLTPFPLLFDPQTSGGLLGAIPASEAESCLKGLREAGYSRSALIGKVLPLGEAVLPIQIEF